MFAGPIPTTSTRVLSKRRGSGHECFKAFQENTLVSCAAAHVFRLNIAVNIHHQA